MSFTSPPLSLTETMACHPRLSYPGMGHEMPWPPSRYLAAGEHERIQLRKEKLIIDRRALMEHEEDVLLVASWVARLTMRKTINERTTSYGLKHVIEKILDRYISDGVCIAAFLMHRFPWRLVHPGSLSCHFAVSNLSLKQIWYPAHDLALKQERARCYASSPQEPHP